MNILLSLISSGALKWLSILILIFGLIGGAYQQHRKIVENEKLIALQQYNINQLQQNVKDKDLFIEQLNSIAKNKDAEISKLQKQREALDNKSKAIESDIDVEVGKGHDRPSSDILKETIRKLDQ